MPYHKNKRVSLILKAINLFKFGINKMVKYMAS